MGRFDFLNDELNRLRREGLYNNIRTIESPQGAWIQIDGRRVLNLCSNNYLGLANDPRLRERAARALEQWGVGPGAVRIIAGTTRLHLELEEKLAAFKHRQSAVLFGSGLLANQGVIPAIADAPEDAIFTDELNHASIIDGCRLSRAARQIYRHLDLDDLRAKLGAASGARRRLIITDGVFSMDGDIAPLPDLVAVAREHDALLMVDDAHGDGVLGSHGRGIVDHFGLRDEVDIEVGTLSKAFGVIGGFAAGAAPLAEYLKQKSRAFTFTSALTAVDVAACLAGLDLLSEDDAPVRRLWDNAAHFKAGLTRAGFDVGASRTPITPVMLGEAETAQAFSQRLYERGIFATSIGFPIVARGRARIRCMVSAAHETTDLDLAVEAFAQVGRELAVLA